VFPGKAKELLPCPEDVVFQDAIKKGIKGWVRKGLTGKSLTDWPRKFVILLQT